MKRKRFSVEQIVAVLKQAELGMPVADLIRQFGLLRDCRGCQMLRRAGAAMVQLSMACSELDRPAQALANFIENDLVLGAL